MNRAYWIWNNSTGCDCKTVIKKAVCQKGSVARIRSWRSPSFCWTLREITTVACLLWNHETLLNYRRATRHTHRSTSHTCDDPLTRFHTWDVWWRLQLITDQLQQGRTVIFFFDALLMWTTIYLLMTAKGSPQLHYVIDSDPASWWGLLSRSELDLAVEEPP